jgi:hypothetical protein
MDTLNFLRNRALARRRGTYLGERLGKGLCSVQHDYDIGNAAGGVVRGDINDVLDAIVTWNSGASQPATMFARQRWADTTAGVIKRRNAANSDWIIESTDDETFVLSRSSDTALDVSDIGKTIRATGTYTQTFNAISTLPDGWSIGVRVEAGAILTLDPNSSEQIDGANTKVIVGPASGFVCSNGSAFYTIGFTRIVISAQQNASGVAVQFTGIPAGTRRIKVMGSGVSTNGTSGIMVTLGDAGGIELTGYTGGVSVGAASTAFTTGFGIMEAAIAANTYDFVMTLELQNAAVFRWSETGLCIEAAVAQGHRQSTGFKGLSAELTQLQVQMVNGTDAFDAGVISVSYES